MTEHSFVRTADGATLGVRLTGDGPLLVLVSGLSGLGAYWAPLVERLGDSFRILTYDHRGVGQSSRTNTDYSLPEMAGDLVAILDTFATEPVILMGHSTGGALAQRVAIEHPSKVARLVLSATWARACLYLRRLFTSRLEVLETMGMEAYLRYSQLFLHTPRWLADHLPPTGDAAPRDDLAQMILRRKIAAILTHDSLDLLHRIACPALTFVADDDRVTPPHLSQEIAANIPGCRYAVLPNGGHFALHEQTESYTRCVAEFLEAAPP